MRAVRHARGMAGDLDFADLGEVQRRVVDPVLQALFKPGELLQFELHVGHPLGMLPAYENDAPEVWLRAVDSDGDTFSYRLGKATSDHWNAEDVAGDLADALQDMICESRYGWGEAREATPSRRPRDAERRFSVGPRPTSLGRAYRCGRSTRRRPAGSSVLTSGDPLDHHGGPTSRAGHRAQSSPSGYPRLIPRGSHEQCRRQRRTPPPDAQGLPHGSDVKIVSKGPGISSPDLAPPSWSARVASRRRDRRDRAVQGAFIHRINALFSPSLSRSQVTRESSSSTRSFTPRTSLGMGDGSAAYRAGSGTIAIGAASKTHPDRDRAISVAISPTERPSVATRRTQRGAAPSSAAFAARLRSRCSRNAAPISRWASRPSIVSSVAVSNTPCALGSPPIAIVRLAMTSVRTAAVFT
jgi:hypothetical protein